MGWTGKIVGGVLGLALGPFGAALGVALGHQYDQKQGKRPDADNGLPLDQRFYRTTFRVMGHVAKADGRVSEREIAAARGFMDSLRLGEPQRLAAIRLFGIGKSPGYDLADDLRQLRTACTDAPELLRVFLEIQIRVALAGNDMAGPARLRLGQVALKLGFPAAQFVRFEASLRSGARQGASPAGVNHEARLTEAYRALELEPGASDEDVTRAYRRQMSRHHPDKLKANGLPDSMLEHAKERTQQVREAYELLREHRGLG